MDLDMEIYFINHMDQNVDKFLLFKLIIMQGLGICEQKMLKIKRKNQKLK